jgi:hypothetical protein
MNNNGFDADFGVAEWYGTNAFIRDGDSVYRHDEYSQPEPASQPTSHRRPGRGSCMV